MKMQMPDEAFTIQMALVKPEEGGYSNDPDDPGGVTNWGILQTEARACGYTGDMYNLTWDQALAIYKTMYWQQPMLDQLCLIDDLLARKLLDAGINQGTKTANMFLQTALTKLSNNGANCSDPGGVDGVLGAMTRHSLTTLYNARGDEGRNVVRGAVMALQIARYFDLETTNAALSKYEYGWLVRAVSPIVEPTTVTATGAMS